MKPHSHNEIPENQLTPLARAFLWVEEPKKVRLAIILLAALCAVLFVLDFIIHRHSYAPFEHIPGFYAVTGFIAFSFVVLASTALRWVIGRREDYYSPNAVDAETYPEEGLSRELHPGAPAPAEKESDA